VAHETAGSMAPDNNLPAAFHALQRLRPRLATLMGNAGLRGLLSRSLALSGEEIHWLRAVHVKSDGSLTGLQQLHVEVPPEQFLEGAVELLVHLLRLLVVFMGESLTLRLMSETWPSLSNLDLGKGD